MVGPPGRGAAVTLRPGHSAGLHLQGTCIIAKEGRNLHLHFDDAILRLPAQPGAASLGLREDDNKFRPARTGDLSGR